MAWKVSNEYNKVIYSGDAKHKLKLLFNGVEYETANVKTESVKIKDNILSTGEERFSLDNFVSKEVEIVIHDIELSDIIEPVNISIGTLVGDSYEYVPIGIFNLQDTPTTDSGKTTIKLRDNSVKFDYPYDASLIIEQNGGSVTMLALLQDICNKFGVELGTLDFPNKDTEISVWDNTINARKYIMYIAEKSGCLAKIDRLGKLILVDINKEEDKSISSDTNEINIIDSLPRELKEFKIYGKSIQNGIPTFEEPIEIDSIPSNNNFYININEEQINIDVQNKKFYSINNIEDESDIISGKCIKRIKEITLTGDENWIYHPKNSSRTNTVLFSLENVINDMEQKTYDFNTLCTHSQAKDVYRTDQIGYFIHYSGKSYIYISVDRNNINDLNTFKNYLKEQYNNGTPIKILYILNEPEEFYLDSTIIKLNDGINNIYLIENLETTIEIKYQQKKIPIEIPIKIIESYKAGDKLKISRVVYEDAIRKFEFGDETNQTLYINSANPYITDSKEIENVYEYIKDFEIYSLSTGKIIGNPALDSDDLIEFTYNNVTYVTLGQNELTYNGVIIQKFNTQLGSKEKAQENVTLNSDDSNYKRIYTRINQAEGNIELNTSQITNVQTDLKENYYNLEQTNQLIQNAQSGLTNTFSEAGGNNIFRNTGLWFENSGEESQNNPYEFWTGKVVKEKEENSANMTALLLQNNILEQEQLVPNGNYTISFKYKKLIELSSVKCKINDVEFDLSETNDTEFIQTINVSSQHINIQFISDTNNSCKIYDLMVNAGAVKLAYSQNQNETTTDTVNISKGITITSTDTHTTFKANSDGIRIYDSKDLANPKTKFIDKGTETDYLKVKNDAEVVDILIQKVGNHTWLTKI